MPITPKNGKIKIGYSNSLVDLKKDKSKLHLCRFARQNKHQLKYIVDGKKYCVFITEDDFNMLKDTYNITVKTKCPNVKKTKPKSLRDKPAKKTTKKKTTNKKTTKPKSLREKPKKATASKAKSRTACNRRKSKKTCESKKSKIKCKYVKRGAPRGTKSGLLKKSFCRTGKNKKKSAPQSLRDKKK